MQENASQRLTAIAIYCKLPTPFNLNRVGSDMIGEVGGVRAQVVETAVKHVMTNYPASA